MEALLKGAIRPDLFLTHWDDLPRLAASLKMGCVTASLMIGKLQGYPRQNALTRALQEYGRLVKTIFILWYLESEEYRKRINGQINKGEALHALRRFLFFAHEGKIQQQREDGQTSQAHCLNLVTNAVITCYRKPFYFSEHGRDLHAENIGYALPNRLIGADLLGMAPWSLCHLTSTSACVSTEL